MSKIGDLFVRLGLKKDEFSKGIKEAKRESSSFVDSMKNIGVKGKIAFAAVSAAIAGTIAAVKQLAQQNQILGDAVQKTGAGLSAMWDTMKTAIAALDFSNLIDNLREANRLARDLYDAQDAMGEIGTSYNISLAQQLKHINDLKLALRDQTLSDEERVKKGEELLAIYKKLEQNPTRGLGNVKDATLDYYMQRMGVNMNNRTDAQLAAMRKKYVDFFKWLGTAEGENYSNAAQQVMKSGGLNSYLGRTYMANAEKAGRGEYARLAASYNSKMGDKDREAIEKAVVEYYQQEAKYSAETLRIQTQINAIKSQQAESSTPSGQRSQADIEREQAEKIQKRAEDAAKSEIQLLTEKYEQEKGLLEQYGIDTIALYDEYISKLKGLLDTKLTDKVIKIDFEVDEADLSDVDDEIQAFIDEFIMEYEDKVARIQELSNAFADAVTSGFSSGCQEMAEQLMGLSELNAGAVFQALLNPLADMAIKAGEIIMAEGIATEAAKSAMETFGETGWGAVAAGAALVAAGAAAKAGLKAIAATGGKNTSASSYSGSSGSSGTQTIETELTVNVRGTIRGSDIVLSGQKTVNSWGR
jgi:hypothetical protein